MGGLWMMNMFLFLLVYLPDWGVGGNSGTNAAEATNDVYLTTVSDMTTATTKLSTTEIVHSTTDAIFASMSDVTTTIDRTSTARMITSTTDVYLTTVSDMTTATTKLSTTEIVHSTTDAIFASMSDVTTTIDRTSTARMITSTTVATSTTVSSPPLTTTTSLSTANVVLAATAAYLPTLSDLTPTPSQLSTKRIVYSTTERHAVSATSIHPYTSTPRPYTSTPSQYTRPPLPYTTTPYPLTGSPRPPTTNPPAYTCTPVPAIGDGNITIQLVGGNCYQGYVVLTIDGEAGTICADGFGFDDAIVVCQMLGLSGGAASEYGRSHENMLLFELECYGHESSIMECIARKPPQHCWSDAVAAVSCIRAMPPADEVVVELVGGDSKSGRVELIMYGERGTVCDDSWDGMDAKVICRMLGFYGGRAFRESYFGEGVGKIWLDEVRCSGTENNISECHLSFDEHDCTHREDAGVSCYNVTTVELAGAVYPRIGRVSIIIDGVEAKVCGEYFDQQDATVVCRELGYSQARISNGNFGGGSSNNSINLDCYGRELSIGDCESAITSRICSLDAGVICSDEEFLDVFLFGEDEGQAVVHVHGQIWDLCPDNWDDADALVFCKTMGYTHGMVTEGLEEFYEPWKQLADLGCSGDETHIRECDQSGWTNSCSQNTSSFAICIRAEETVSEGLGLGLNVVFLLSNCFDMESHTKTLQEYLLSNIIDGISRIIDEYIENPFSTGLITYSSSANSDLFLGLCLNNACTSDNLKDLLTVSNEIGNAVDVALDLATTHFSDQHGHGILAPNLCILFVTSPLDNVTQTMEAAQRLKDQGVVLMVVAVGDGVKSEQLEGLASDTKVSYSAEVGEDTSEESLFLVANDTAETLLKAQKYALILPRYSKCYHGYIDFTIIIDLQVNNGTVVDQIIGFLGKFRNSTEVVVSIWIKDDPTSQYLLPLQNFVNTNRKFSLGTGKNLPEIMEMARVNFVEEHKDRKLAENIILIVTDELLTAHMKAVEKESCMCQKAKIHVMALGIGNQMSSEQLSAVASDERAVIIVDSVKRLQKGLDGLVKQLCPAACDVGWIYYDGNCYRSEKTRSSWLEAQKHCSNMDASLISITSPEVELWLHSTFLQENPEIKSVLIGLRKQKIKNSPLSYGYRWENGKPLRHSRCCLNKENGDCVQISADTTMWNSIECELEPSPSTYRYLLVCEKQAANNTISKKVADVAPLHDENACTFSNTSTDVLYTSGNHCRSVLDVFRSRTFVNYTFTCSNKELISLHLVCDGLNHCTDGSDEKNCSGSCETELFPCDNGRCVSLAFVCDFSNDCGDNSDEAKCVVNRCEDYEFECDSGQCIPSTSVCDLYNDCYDRTDELDCTEKCNQFSCNDDICIPRHWIRDGTVDCDGDESVTPIPRLVYEGQYSQLNILYTNSSRMYQPKVDLDCTMVFDKFGKTFTMDNCSEPVICPIGFHRCPSSYCIPIDRICDGVMDCNNGEDEADCDDYLCPGYFRCPGLSYCIHPALVCNGEINCPGGKDETMCNFTCPSYCSCQTDHVVCKDIDFDLDDLDARTRSFEISDSNILNSPFDKFQFMIRSKMTNVGLTGVDIIQNNYNLRELDLSQNNISQILRRSFVNLRELRVLDLSANSFQAIDGDAYIGLESLEVLILKSNRIAIIGMKAFSSLPSLKVLDVSDNSIQEISDDAFHGLQNLQTLFIQNNKITKYGRSVYKGVDNIETIETDVFALCCPSVRPRTVINCKSPESSISSCDDLLGNEYLRLCIWILCITSILGNIISTVMRVWLERASMKNGFGVFVTNLGISDFFMGMYLLIIAVADNHFRGHYVWNDTTWRESIFCKVAGFLSTLSSEASTFFICLITLDRFIVIWFPFSNVRFRLRSGIVASVIAWLVAAAIAYMPLTPWFMYWDFYGKNGACLALPFSTERTPGWLYSTIIFTGLNFGSFLFIAIGQYLIYRAIKQDSMVASSAGRKRELAVARGLLLIVCSDFLCWFPVGVMSLMALSGIQIGGEVYAFTAVFVLPVNSALNPFLYTIPALLRRRRTAKKHKEESLYKTNRSLTRVSSLQGDHVPLEDALEQVDGILRVQLLDEIMKRLSTIPERIATKRSSDSSNVNQDNPLHICVQNKWLSKFKKEINQSSELKQLE